MKRFWLHIIFSIAFLGAISDVFADTKSYEKVEYRGRAANVSGKGVKVPKSNAGSKIKIDPKQTNHIFRNKVGHLKDTPNNRALLEKVGSNQKLRLGTDRYGNSWHAQINQNGSQTWVKVRNGQIVNGGVNKTPKSFNQETGLCALRPPNSK